MKTQFKVKVKRDSEPTLNYKFTTLKTMQAVIALFLAEPNGCRIKIRN